MADLTVPFVPCTVSRCMDFPPSHPSGNAAQGRPEEGESWEPEAPGLGEEGTCGSGEGSDGVAERSGVSVLESEEASFDGAVWAGGVLGSGEAVGDAPRQDHSSDNDAANNQHPAKEVAFKGVLPWKKG